VKVRTDEKNRSEVLQLCEVFRTRVVNVTNTAVTVEATGDTDKIDGLLNVLRPFGILEMVRTGSVAMSRTEEEELHKLLDDSGNASDPATRKKGDNLAA